MRLVKYKLFACILLGGCCGAALAAPPNPKPARPTPATRPASANISLAALLPPGRVRVAVMQPEPSPRLAQLSRKMQEGIRKNPQWFMAEIQKVKPGENIPYDARLNLTREEYSLLNHPAPQMQLRKVGSGVITIRGVGTRRVLSGEGTLFGLNGIEIDLQRQSVKTPLGVLNAPTPVKANAGQSADAAWNGWAWKLDTMAHKETPSQTTGTTAEFTIGKLVKSGRIQLTYQAQQMNGGKPQSNFAYLLHYSASPQPLRRH